MDISKWLQETAHRGPPSSPSGPQLPRLAQAQTESRHHPRRDHKRRQRASSDSSLIALRKAHHRPQTSSPRRKNRTLTEDDNSSTREYASSQSIRQKAKEKSYERRPRHKTRPERYEPKSRGYRDHGKKEGGRPSRRKRKSRRTGDGDRTTVLVQSFQLKNGSRNGRLTLKPDHHVGLFKHGRAGPQVIGRGNGLPDLVFNEMRFLQKPTEHQDEPPAAGEPWKRGKDGQKRQDKEISSYFKPANVTGDGHPDEPKQHSSRTEQRPNVKKRSKDDQVAALVDLPEKPFLGFGSRGALPEGKQVQDAGMECFSWSDSLPGHMSPVPQRQPAVSARHVQADIGHRYSDHMSSVAHHAIQGNGDHTLQASARVVRENTAQSRRVAKPISQRPPQKHRPEGEHVLQSQTTHQSLSRLPLRESREHDRYRPERQSKASSKAYRTSDILDVRLRKLSPSPERRSISQRLELSDKENDDPHGSMDELLSMTRAALTKPLPTGPLPLRSNRRPLEALSNAQERMLQLPVREETHKPMLDRPSYSIGHGQLTHSDLMPQNEQGVGKGIFSLAPHDCLVDVLTEHTTSPWHAVGVQEAAIGAEQMLPYDDERMLHDEMFSHRPAPEGVYLYSEHEGESDRNVVEDVERLGRVYSTGSMGIRMSIRGLPAEEEFKQTEPFAQATQEEDEFAGFWKPNKLY